MKDTVPVTIAINVNHNSVMYAIIATQDYSPEFTNGHFRGFIKEVGCADILEVFQSGQTLECKLDESELKKQLQWYIKNVRRG